MQCVNSEDLFFNDGKRRIDMIIAFEEDEDKKRDKMRRNFIGNLEDEGFDMEVEDPASSLDGLTVYVKVHAPWDVLTRYAELLSIKVPIKENEGIDYSHRSWWHRHNPFRLDPRCLPEEKDYIMASYIRNKESLFLLTDRDTFFTSAQRSQMVWQSLNRARYGNEALEIGITRLIKKDVFKAAYPLHDGPYDMDCDKTGMQNNRRILYLEWARLRRCFKEQPLWLIRRYFGNKIALYFAWLGFYTKMLIPASVVGILCFIYGIFSTDTDNYIPVREVCDKNGAGKLIMCPLCDKYCNYWNLSDSCLFSKLTYPIDNPATVFFAIFMAFWATVFLELWKRRQAVLGWEWDLGTKEAEEVLRPEFEAEVKTTRINPVTKAPELYLPIWKKTVRTFGVSSFVLFMLFVVIGVMVGVIQYRVVVGRLINSSDEEVVRDVFLKYSKLITSTTAACINLGLIFMLNWVYHKLALWLTNKEFPRTRGEFEDSFTFKMFLFQFLNYYSALIYIAFFKGRFYHNPGIQRENKKFDLFALRDDRCDVAGCLSELFIQLSITMVGKQAIGNFMEFFLPLKGTDELSLFGEYLEMVVQYGFVTLFVTAFPLAPFFALLNNILEIRLDAYKMLVQQRRPLAQKAQDIGAWYGILQGITYTAIVTNAMIIAFTSDFVPQMVYKYEYSPDMSLNGYVESSLAVFNTSDFSDAARPILDEGEFDPGICRYRAFRNDPDHHDAYEYSDKYWHVTAARLSLIVVFEHVVFALTGVLSYAIPDVPKEVVQNKALERNTMFEVMLNKLRFSRK